MKHENKKNRHFNKENRNDRSVLNETGVDKKRSAVNLQEFEQLSEKAVDLIFNNKINAKNAFDVNVDFLDKLPHLLKKNEETSWQKASASLDASAKIYGYRVDSVHSETFKFLGGLTRAEEKIEGQNPEDEERRKKIKENRHEGYSTLESNPKKLDLVKYDLEFEVDPLFKSMTVKFGDSGARGLLLKTLPLDCNLDVFLESKSPTEKESFKAFKKESPQEVEKILEDQNDEDRSNPYTEDKNTSIHQILDKVINKLSINELKSVEICPDLTYFKKGHQLDVSLGQSFFQHLREDINDTLLRDDIILGNHSPSDSFDQSLQFAENDNLENFSSLSQKSSYESNISAKFDDLNLNINNFGDLKQHLGVSYMEGFSYLKSDEIKEYIHQFGDGNKNVFRNIPHYKNFTKSFGQLEKFNSITNPISNNDEKKRVKKEEILFQFDPKNEVLKSDIFEKENKPIKTNWRDNFKKKNKKKVKQFFHYDRSALFNLFTIQERIMNENNRQINQTNHQNLNDDNFAEELPDDIPQEENAAPSFMKVDSEYEKKFGRLYKTFDVRLIKSKIWDSINKTNNKTKNLNEGIEFKKILDSVYTNLSKDVISNISTSTCFVCLLHLSNEKSKLLFIFRFSLRTGRSK